MSNVSSSSLSDLCFPAISVIITAVCAVYGVNWRQNFAKQIVPGREIMPSFILGVQLFTFTSHARPRLLPIMLAKSFFYASILTKSIAQKVEIMLPFMLAFSEKICSIYARHVNLCSIMLLTTWDLTTMLRSNNTRAHRCVDIAVHMWCVVNNTLHPGVSLYWRRILLCFLVYVHV